MSQYFFFSSSEVKLSTYAMYMGFSSFMAKISIFAYLSKWKRMYLVKMSLLSRAFDNISEI